MALYAISDLHLALNTDKPMDIFGEKWRNHHEKIKENWNNKITEEDTVLIAGDIDLTIITVPALVFPKETMIIGGEVFLS